MGLTKWRKVLIIAGALILTGSASTGALADDVLVKASIMAALTRNFFLTLDAPAGTTTTESNPAYKQPAGAPASTAANVQAPGAAAADWPSYNRTLTSERFSPLSQINTKNVGGLKVLCTYDTGEFTAFESGLIMVNNAHGQ
jgi:alcohol dehydrogenase (cytochrome c)